MKHLTENEVNAIKAQIIRLFDGVSVDQAQRILRHTEELLAETAAVSASHNATGLDGEQAAGIPCEEATRRPTPQEKLSIARETLDFLESKGLDDTEKVGVVAVIIESICPDMAVGCPSTR